MNVNFNNLRRQVLIRFDELTIRLNKAINKEEEKIEIEICEIQELMDDLRQMIGAIAMVYDEDNPDFAEIYNEVFPEPRSMAVFNPEDEE